MQVKQQCQSDCNLLLGAPTLGLVTEQAESTCRRSISASDAYHTAHVWLTPYGYSSTCQEPHALTLAQQQATVPEQVL